MAHLLPTAIFSPSAARKQLAVAKEWNYIDEWLLVKFNGKSPPTFERNTETLKALLALAAVNEAADEEDALLTQCQAKAMGDFQAVAAQDPNADLLASLEQNLTREGRNSLEALSGLSVTLKRSLPEIEKLGLCILDLQVTSDILEQNSTRLAALEIYLNSELENINSLVQELQSQAYQPQSDPIKNAIHYQRKIKAATSKLPELRDRVALLSNNVVPTSITLHDIKLEEAHFKDLSSLVQELETEVKSFCGLPHDVQLARLELDALRAEVFKLTRQRDGMFEGLVERASPKKT
ncbi:hypothetical protein K3495_g1014 [Podosphaera aphanis]|nr:hypothetical protein K3495_g1014 [Podosphaera aphanis]